MNLREKFGSTKVVEPGVWKPEKQGDKIEGVLATKIEKGNETSAKYYIDDGNNLTLVWGSTVLDDRMQFVNVGDYVIITFKENKELDKGRTLKIYQVESAKPKED